MNYCVVNGVVQDHIAVESRGLAYGDGLFTTAKIINGRVEYLPAHINRLTLGCKALAITLPNVNALTTQLEAIAKPYTLAVLKVIITASTGGRGYARAANNNIDIIISVHDFPTHYHQLHHHGLHLGDSLQQLGCNPMLAGLKHLNRLEQVLLRKELDECNYDDLLVTNINNHVVETTSANVFFYLDGKLHTPEIIDSGVNGIMRQTLLALYPGTIVSSYSLDDLAQVEAMFVCNCIMGVVPINTYNDKALDTAPVKVIQQQLTNVMGEHH